MLIISLTLGACSTTLGYVPHDVYVGTSKLEVYNLPPEYEKVRKWAVDVADGYDTRATLNRQALYGGALVATGGASALVAFAAFAPGSGAMIGIPIGTTFLSGVMAIYNNEQKAAIYQYASQTIRDLLIQSDCRMVNPCPTAADTKNRKLQEAKATADTDLKTTDDEPCKKWQAVCLHAEVSEVMRKVNDHIALLDPKNVVDTLKGVTASIEAKKALVAQASARQKAAEDAGDTEKTEKAKADLKKAEDDLKTAQDQAAAQILATAANDFSDLKVVPRLCETPPDCQFRK